MGNRKVKRYGLTVLLALGAMLVAFGVAYAGFVQVTREVPASIMTADVEALDPSALALFEDADLSIPLMGFYFVVPQWLPPLDEIFNGGSGQSRPAEFWARNDTVDIPLKLVWYGNQIKDATTDEWLGWYWVEWDGCDLAGDCEDTLLPGQSRRGVVHLDATQRLISRPQPYFDVIIASVGKTSNGAAGSATIQSFIDEAKSQAESQGEPEK